MVVISSAVEGSTDEAIAKRLIKEAGGEAGTVYGKNGKSALRTRIRGFNNAARHSPWLVLVDLDNDECAAELVRGWLPERAERLCFRVAVREAEAWLLADRERIATFLSVPVSRVPRNVEAEHNPKRVIVDLAARSRKNAIRDDIVPRPGSGRNVGPAYASRIIEFINAAQTGWRPEVAVAGCDSLRRALDCLKRLVENAAEYQAGVYRE